MFVGTWHSPHVRLMLARFSVLAPLMWKTSGLIWVGFEGLTASSLQVTMTDCPIFKRLDDLHFSQQDFTCPNCHGGFIEEVGERDDQER